MLRPPIDGADPSTSAHHRSLNVVPVFICVFLRARDLVNLSPGTCGQVIPSIISYPLVQTKVATDSGTGLAVLRTCRYSGSSGTSGGDGSGDGSDADAGDDSGGDHDGGCDDDTDGGSGGGCDDGCFGGILFRVGRSNPLTAALPADRATEAAAASATTASLQRRRH